MAARKPSDAPAIDRVGGGEERASSRLPWAVGGFVATLASFVLALVSSLRAPEDRSDLLHYPLAQSAHAVEDDAVRMRVELNAHDSCILLDLTNKTQDKVAIEDITVDWVFETCGEVTEEAATGTASWHAYLLEPTFKSSIALPPRSGSARLTLTDPNSSLAAVPRKMSLLGAERNIVWLDIRFPRFAHPWVGQVYRINVAVSYWRMGAAQRVLGTLASNPVLHGTCTRRTISRRVP